MTSELEKLKESGLSLDVILKELGLKAVASVEKKARDTRAERYRSWLEPGKKLEGVEKERITSLAEVLGQATILDELRELTQDEVDALTEELIAIRTSWDITNARADQIRKTVFTSLNAKFAEDEGISEPEFEAGTIYSPKHGFKLVRQIRGGSSYVEWSDLEDLLPAEVWTEITDRVVTERRVYKGDSKKSEPVVKTVTREINEERVMQAFRDDKITLEHLAAITKVKPKIAAFTPKPIKDGEEVTLQQK